MGKFVTYIYRDPSRNDEPFYVGKGTLKRANGHRLRTDKHPFTQRLQKMAKNNILPVIEIIDAIDEDHAYFMEECLVSIFGRKNLGTGPLLNLTDGGRGPKGKKLSDEAKRKISEAQLGKKLSNEHKEKIRVAMTGMVQPLSKGLKISASKKGVKNSAEHNANLSKAIKGKPWTAARRAAHENRNKQ